MVDPLINQLAKLVVECAPRGKNWPRLRIAVSPDEYLHIRDYMLRTYGDFFEAIMGIKLIVDKEPMNRDVYIRWQDENEDKGAAPVSPVRS